MTDSKKTNPRFAVVIVTYNGAKWIDHCIRSVSTQNVDMLTIVVDNASTDDTVQRLTQTNLGVTLIRSEKNLGFGAGNNLGIRRALDAGAEYVFLLNQDAYLLDECLQRLDSFMVEHPEVGISAPLHCSPTPDEIDRRTFRGYLQCYASDYLCDAAMGRVKESYAVHGINAAGWCVRANVFRAHGGFDPLFFMYGEDDDLLLRWSFHKVRFELLPGARMVHLRQSPASPKVSYWRRTWLLSERRKSELLKAVKNPAYSAVHAIAVLVAKGFLTPWSDVLVTRDWQTFMASYLAAARLATQLHRVMAHARITAQHGEHFLAGLQATQAVETPQAVKQPAR